MTVRIVDNQRKCRVCKKWKNLNLFHLKTKKDGEIGYRARCKKCMGFNEIPVQRFTRKRRNDHHIDYKQMILDHYGNACACCNETGKKFLTVDHVDDDGYKYRRNGNYRLLGRYLYIYLVENNYPGNISILCFNCNIGRNNNGGVCPHQQENLDQ